MLGIDAADSLGQVKRNYGFQPNPAIDRRRNWSQILSFATKLPAMNFQKNFCRKTQTQKSGFCDRHLRQELVVSLRCLRRRRYGLFMQGPDMPKGIKDGRNTMTIVGNL